MNNKIVHLATSKSTGLYIICKHCKKEEFILNPKAMEIDQRHYTCSSQCNDMYYKALGEELDAHDEYCDLCNSNNLNTKA